LCSLIAPLVARKFFRLKPFLPRGLSIGAQKVSIGIQIIWTGLSELQAPSAYSH
jgi:hypothetical protein